MLSVQSPLQLAMSNDNVYDDGNATWNAWRAHTNLPTPPSSDPPRRLAATKWLVDNGHHQRPSTGNGVEPGRQEDLTLPPIAHLDRHWPTSSPLTPPDDEMHPCPPSIPTWRDAKPGPSRLHSPMTATSSPLAASPFPSPVDEYEQYEGGCDAMDEQVDEVDEAGNAGWDWDGRQQQDQCAEEAGLQEQPGADDQQMQQSSWGANLVDNNGAADWITNPSQLSAHFIAEKTCEMVCYLWFSSSLGPRSAAVSRARRDRERSERRRAKDASPYLYSPPFVSRPLSNPSTAALQFCASAEFVAFMAKLLTTTQVSQSVIVLSLHYIFRLKERNDFTLGKPGSEFRVAVCALMLANKFVDDNTYTNKTWSEVSAIPLEELNKMEREFLLGVGFQLYVDAQTYDKWLNLLKGLVLTKEREYSRWRERRRARVAVPRIVIPGSGEQTRHLQRARSTSPQQSRNYSYAPAYPFTFSVPSTSAAQLQVQSYSTQTSPNRPVSSKRTAGDAFSPTSANFAEAGRGAKRPTGLALDIPAALASVSSRNGCDKAGAVSAHPTYAYSDSLRGLESMSLATPVDQQARSGAENQATEVPNRREPLDHTLAAAYRGIDAARRPPPPQLYFYALASSPLSSSYAAQTSSSYVSSNDSNSPAIDEPSVPRENIDFLPAGAERKTRLRYVDSHATGDYAPNYATYGYEHGIAQGGYQSQPAYPVHAPGSTNYSSSSSSSYPHTRPHSHQQSSQPLQRHQQGQQPQHLPPLTLALSMHPASSLAPVSQVPNTRTSPLPGFASLNAYALPPAAPLAYADPQPRVQDPSCLRSYSAQVPNNAPDQTFSTYAYSNAPNLAPAPALASAWSAPASETVDGVYVPQPRHIQPHAYSHAAEIQQQRSYASLVQSAASNTYNPYASTAYNCPQQQEARHPVADGSTSSSSYPERAAFANAGPPGVVNFYPYARSGSLSGADGYNETYGPSLNPSLGKVPYHSYSTTASPEGPYLFDHDYAMRTRRP